MPQSGIVSLKNKVAAAREPKPRRRGPGSMVGSVQGSVLERGSAELNRAKRTLQTRHRALANVVGRRLLVFWPRDAKFYRGRVAGYDSANGKHRVVYDDGDEERVNLAKQRVMWEGGADDDTRAAMNALGESRRREGKKKRGGGADGAAEAAAGRDTKRKRTTKKTPKKKAESEEEGAPISGAVEADGCKEGVGEPERTEKVGREGPWRLPFSMHYGLVARRLHMTYVICREPQGGKGKGVKS